MYNKLVGIFSVMLFSSTALAQDAVEAIPTDLGEMIKVLAEAAKGGKWSIVVSVGIMLLVFLATKIKFIGDLLPSSWKPWIAVSAGVLSSIAATGFATGNWITAVLNGLVTGAAASGFWDLVGKKLLKKKDA